VADSRLFMREADLQHHLTGEGEKAKADAAKVADKPAEMPAEKPAPAKLGPDVKAPAKPDAKAAVDPAKREDLQLIAAVKHLKGLPITAAATAK